MKHIVQLSSTILLSLVLFSCAVQQHTTNALSTYQAAMSKYEKKDYHNAGKLFQEAIPLLTGKKEIIPAQFHLAQCYFHEKKYRESAHYFAEFYKTYPRLPETEEARYMQGYSIYLLSPDIRRDATKTEKALQLLQQYRQRYPKGTYQPQVQQCIQELQDKLALKAFRNANLYYRLGHYQATVIAFNNFQETYSDTVYNEEAIYIKIKAQCKWAEATAMQDQATTMEDQLNSWKMIIQYYHELLDQYPGSKYMKEVQAAYEQALQKVDQLVGYQTMKNN